MFIAEKTQVYASPGLLAMEDRIVNMDDLMVRHVVEPPGVRHAQIPADRQSARPPDHRRRHDREPFAGKTVRDAHCLGFHGLPLDSPCGSCKPRFAPCG